MRARYGHGGRLGYESEWRARRAVSGGGELVDQGMHLLDLSYALLGPLPLHSALLRTAFWPMEVEDNAVVILGDRADGPWTMFHASWTEWKNLFSLEIFCRSAKLQVDGLARSYGAQRLTIYSMRPELGPPDVETTDFAADDESWRREWQEFAEAIHASDDRPLVGRPRLGAVRVAVCRGSLCAPCLRLTRTRPALLPVAVLVGGRGTRLGDLARHTPKALVPVAGDPFVFHQLRLLAAHGARRVVLCVGHLGEQIADAVGDGARFGLDVEYAFDGPEPVGTAAALRQASPLLGERFLVTYGDAYLRADHGAVQDAFRRGGDPALMTVVQNDGRWVTSNAVFHDGRVTAYDKRVPPPEARWVDYGLLAFDAGVFDGARRRRSLRRLPRARGARSARRAPRARAVLRDRHARGARGDRGVPARRGHPQMISSRHEVRACGDYHRRR